MFAARLGDRAQGVAHSADAPGLRSVTLTRVRDDPRGDVHGHGHDHQGDSMRLAGLHHVTMITGNAQRTVDFYVDLLGLRLVKKTINFDDPTP
jgi:hypothetical protein